MRATQSEVKHSPEKDTDRDAQKKKFGWTTDSPPRSTPLRVLMHSSVRSGKYIPYVLRMWLTLPSYLFISHTIYTQFSYSTWPSHLSYEPATSNYAHMHNCLLYTYEPKAHGLDAPCKQCSCTYTMYIRSVLSHLFNVHL
jgi:hypothetical protein